MRRNYKLAANFNTVELVDINSEDLMEVLDWDTEVYYNNSDEPQWDIEDEELLARLLQREYDILAGIKVVPPQPTSTTTTSSNKKDKKDKPSEKQILWAKNLGMKNPEKSTSYEVSKYIQEHRNRANEEDDD